MSKKRESLNGCLQLRGFCNPPFTASDSAIRKLSFPARARNRSLFTLASVLPHPFLYLTMVTNVWKPTSAGYARDTTRVNHETGNQPILLPSSHKQVCSKQTEIRKVGPPGQSPCTIIKNWEKKKCQLLKFFCSLFNNQCLELHVVFLLFLDLLDLHYKHVALFPRNKNINSQTMHIKLVK